MGMGMRAKVFQNGGSQAVVSRSRVASATDQDEVIVSEWENRSSSNPLTSGLLNFSHAWVRGAKTSQAV